jgi:hypothetical protein
MLSTAASIIILVVMSSSSSQKQQALILLPSVITSLIQSDAFWGGLDLDHLRMLVSTCKGFQVEIVGTTTTTAPKKSAKKSKKVVAAAAAAVSTTASAYPPMIEQALLAIIRTHPEKDWCISITNAKYQFSLAVGVLIKHCAALPVDDEFHISAEQIRLYKIRYHIPYISFIDAYRLAVKSTGGGLKGAMERRHRLDVKVKQSARTLSVYKMQGRIPRMRANTRNARTELENQLVDLRTAAAAAEAAKEEKDGVVKKSTNNKRASYVPGEGELRKGLRVLKQLSIDLQFADNDATFMRRELVNEPNSRVKISIRRLETRVHELKVMKTALIARYKAHSMKYAPTFMPLEILEGL